MKKADKSCLSKDKEVVVNPVAHASESIASALRIPNCSVDDIIKEFKGSSKAKPLKR